MAANIQSSDLDNQVDQHKQIPFREPKSIRSYGPVIRHLKIALLYKASACGYKAYTTHYLRTYIKPNYLQSEASTDLFWSSNHNRKNAFNLITYRMKTSQKYLKECPRVKASQKYLRECPRFLNSILKRVARYLQRPMENKSPIPSSIHISTRACVIYWDIRIYNSKNKKSTIIRW